MRRLLQILAAALVIGLTGGPTVVAQNDALQFILEQARQRRALQQQNSQRAAAPRPRDGQQRSAVVVRDTPDQPKVDPHAFVLVIGDSFGELLGGGLQEAYAQQPEIAVLRRAKPESGLVRADFHDWPKTLRDLLAGDLKVTHAVIQMGANDRQPIRDEANVAHEPGSDRWRELYGQRVDAMVRMLVERRIPTFWVGMPPMQAPKFSADMMALNDLVRGRVQKEGGRFIDIWEAFVDSQNRFAAYGPDLAGENVRLRANDGVHFTKAGARKAAHFVELELKRVIENRPDSSVITLQTEPTNVESLPLELQPGGIDRAIDRMAAGLPEPVGIPGLAVKPAAGPILQLNRPPVAPGGALASLQTPAPAGEAQALIERVFGQGLPADPKPGRADDFRWPR
jgi:hypothetical protein